MEEIDVWRSANLLIKQYGEEAGAVAAAKAAAFRKTGDVEGFCVWIQIMMAIYELTKRGPTEDEPVN